MAQASHSIVYPKKKKERERETQKNYDSNNKD